jgi:hypothetical protein
MNHRYPKEGEQLYDYEREAKGLRADGRIWLVNGREQDVTVKFSPNRLEYSEDQTVRINGILHHCHVLLDHPWIKDAGELAVADRVRYEFSDLEWSSNDGGIGAWIHEGGTDVV